MRQTFKKEEKLCSQLLIEKLFTDGKSFSKYPFKILFLPATLETSYPTQILISVSKKKFRKAVDRNKIKRLIREGFRKNKYLIYDYLKSVNKQYIFAIIYISDQMMPFNFIEEKIIASLNRLCENFKKDHQ